MLVAWHDCGCWGACSGGQPLQPPLIDRRSARARDAEEAHAPAQHCAPAAATPSDPRALPGAAHDQATAALPGAGGRRAPFRLRREPSRPPGGWCNALPQRGAGAADPVPLRAHPHVSAEGGGGGHTKTGLAAPPGHVVDRESQCGAPAVPQPDALQRSGGTHSPRTSPSRPWIAGRTGPRPPPGTCTRRGGAGCTSGPRPKAPRVPLPVCDRSRAPDGESGAAERRRFQFAAGPFV